MYSGHSAGSPVLHREVDMEIPADKLGRLNVQIVGAVKAEVLPQKEVWSLEG